MLVENSGVEVVVVGRDLWVEDCKASAVEKADELSKNMSVLVSIHNVDSGTYGNSERPDISRCRPSHGQHDLRAVEQRRAHFLSIFGISALFTHRRTKVGQLYLGNLLCLGRNTDEYVCGLDI